MRTLNHSGIEPYISSPRLNTYRSFFKPANDVELFGCYLWSKEVAAAFFPLLQVLEITLRNAIHKEASLLLGPYWFDNVAVRSTINLSINQKNAQNRAVKQHFSAIKSARDSVRRDLGLSSSAQILEDRIIAKVTFGFWTNLFNVAFDVNRNPLALWPNLLRPVFPNAPKRARGRNTIQGKLTDIKGFRNKAFHHEPIWNIGQPVTVKDAMTRLIDTKELVLEVIRWMSLDSEALVIKAGYIKSVDRICSMEHLEYLKNPGCHDLPLSLAKRELNRLLRASNHNGTTDITRNGVKVGRLLHER